MAIVKMSEITIIAFLPEQNALLESLQTEAIVEIRNLESSELQAARAQGELGVIVSTQQGAKQELISLRLRLQKAIKSLGKNMAAPTLSKYAPTTLDKLNLDAAECEELLNYLAENDDLADDEKRVAQEIERLLLEQKILEPWREIQLNLNKSTTSTCQLFAGSLASRDKLQELELQLATELPESSLQLLGEGAYGLQILALCFLEQGQRLRSLLSGVGFQPLPPAPKNRDVQAAELYQANAAQLQSLHQAQEQYALRVQDIAQHLERFMRLYDHYGILLERLEAKERLSASSSCFALRGWVPSAEAAGLKTRLEERFTCQVTLRTAAKGEETPILLKNNCFSRAFEIIVAMFGAPSSDETDPTPVLGPFYFLIFGMMLSDVGYGSLLVIACAYLLRTGRLKETGSNMCRMLFLSGISSVIWGFVFGGFFGNMIDKLSNGTLSFPILWFNPMEDPMKLMIFSMLFGIIHLFFGMALNMYNKIRQGEHIEAWGKVFPWYLLIIGLLLLALGGAAFNSVLVASIGKGLALLGAAILLVFGGYPARNPFLRLFKGVFSLYDITGYLSDILSYTRILALVLATSVIALVVNELGMILGPSFIGYTLFILVAILGHGLNLALSALSAYVHASRLQYVEFFGKFYTGGGKLFRPLSHKAEYFRLK